MTTVSGGSAAPSQFGVPDLPGPSDPGSPSGSGTALLTGPAQQVARTPLAVVRAGASVAPGSDQGPSPTWPGPLTVARATLGWLLILLAALATVLYLISPILTSEQQQQRTHAFALAMQEAVGAADNSFYGAAAAERPAMGDTVAILQMPRLGVQEAVVEGADPGTTRNGPGHVAGTAGLGQPGNSVVVGRRGMFGAPFGALSTLRVGDQLVANTTQGQSLYRVTSVSTRKVGEETLGASSTDRLTLLTAGSRLPWESSSGVVVTADLVGSPFTPTPQNGRLPAGDGHHGDSEAWALVALLLMAFAGTAVLGTALARRTGGLTAFLVATPILFGVTYLLALAASRTLPGWV